MAKPWLKVYPGRGKGRIDFEEGMAIMQVSV